MMQARTGNAVIDNAAPTNSTAWNVLTSGAKKPPLSISRTASAPPRTSGAAMPAIETAAARRAQRISSDLNSEPDANIEHEADLADDEEA